MERAVAVGLPEPAPQISAIPRGYRSHFSHAGERIWPETNCYLDLWIETLHALGRDPVPTLACVLSAGDDGLQWTFLQQQPEDLRRLYGLEVTRGDRMVAATGNGVYRRAGPDTLRQLRSSLGGDTLQRAAATIL